MELMVALDMTKLTLDLLEPLSEVSPIGNPVDRL
jgi:hypothetical protein